MKVVHVITKGDVGGAQSHVADLARWQKDAGYIVEVITGKAGLMCEQLTAAGIPVEVVPWLTHTVNPLADLRAARRLRTMLVAKRPDVVHSHSSKGGLLARMATRGPRIPSVYTAHGWPFQDAAPFAQRILSWTAEAAMGHWWGHVICLTEAERDLALRKRVVPADRLHIVPLGIPDVPPELVGPPPPSDVLRLVMVARFAPPKDQMGVVEALAGLRGEPWRLTFVGDGPNRPAVESRVEELGLTDQVVFLGERADVPEILFDSDVVLLWSTYEGMPLAVLEALRAGRRVIASGLPGVREILGVSGAGTIAGNRARLTAALASAVRQPSAACIEARRRYLTTFEIGKMAANLAHVYDLLLSPHERQA